MYAEVIFKNESYNYSTSMNEKLSDKEVQAYFIGRIFNLGHIKDNMQKCVDCKIVRI